MPRARDRFAIRVALTPPKQRGSLAVSGLAALEERQRVELATPIATAAFSVDGRRLVALTTGQRLHEVGLTHARQLLLRGRCSLIDCRLASIRLQSITS